MRTTSFVAVFLAVIAAVSIPHRLAAADAKVEGDGYCDYVEGVAEAQRALALAPQAFTEIGYIEPSLASASPEGQASGLRLLAGLSYRVTGLYESSLTRDHASADCRRHEALERVRVDSQYRALDARARVLDAARAEADQLLAAAIADLGAHRTTAQEVTATRLRVEELRQLASDAHDQMSALPPPAPGAELRGALAAFFAADDQIEDYEARQRWLGAFDLRVRAGVDAYLDRPQHPSPYFAVVTLGVNLGTLFQGRGNARAAAGRKRFVRSGHDRLTGDATMPHLRAVVDAEALRLEQTAALQADLERQLETLDRVKGDESRRYRQTVWFEWIKVQAQHAYLEAHVAALRQVLGG